MNIGHVKLRSAKVSWPQKYPLNVSLYYHEVFTKKTLVSNNTDNTLYNTKENTWNTPPIQKLPPR